MIERAISIARDVRADLLRRSNVRRDLAGQCGLAAMRVAVLLKTPEALRIGFYMKPETLCGRRGRYPNQHAWCQVDDTIVDPTATQFGKLPAVHVVPTAETGRGTAAVAVILIDWCRGYLPEYKRLGQQLRASARAS